MTLKDIKKQLLTLCTVQAVNLHGGRFAKCVEKCVKKLFSLNKRLDVVKFDRSIWSYYFHGRTDWELRGVARALRSLGVYTVTLIDGFGQTIVKVRHTGKFVRFRVNPLCICCAWLGRNHAAVLALGLYVPDDLYDLAARVREDAALVASQSKPQEADYEAYKNAGFCVVREGDVGALLDAVQQKLGSGTVLAGVGDADAAGSLMELLLPDLDVADLTNDGDAGLVNSYITHERNLGRFAVYDTRFEDDQRRKMLWTALNLCGEGDCMVRDVLSRTTQRDSVRFTAISGRIDSGRITTLDQLFAEVGASRDQRLHVIYALTTYVNGVWCVDGTPKPLRILATAEQYARSSLTRNRVAVRRAVLASSADSKLVEAVFEAAFSTARGYYGVKDVAAALMEISQGATKVHVLDRREAVLKDVDEAFDDATAVLATSALAENFGEAELQGLLAEVYKDKAWLALTNDSVFFPPSREEVDCRGAEVAFAALKKKADDVKSRLELFYRLISRAEQAVSHAGEASRRAIDALDRLAAGSSVLDAAIAAATSHIDSIDAAVVGRAASAFNLAVEAWKQNNVEGVTAQIDALKAAVDPALVMGLQGCAVRLHSAVVDATWASQQRVPEVTRSTLEALSAHGSLSASLRDHLKTFFDQCAAETDLDRFLGVLNEELAGGLRWGTLHAIERAAGVASTALGRASSVRRIVDGVIDRVRYFEKSCFGGPTAYVALQTLLGSGDAATEGSLEQLIVEDLDTLSHALVPIVQQALLADEPSVDEVLETFDRTVADVWRKLGAADTPSARRRALVSRVADIARRPYVAGETVRRHTDALRAALSGDATAQATLASVDARCGTATDAASVELRGRLVAALGALAGGADAVESRLAAAEAAADRACRDVWALVARLARVADIAALPGAAREAALRYADALRATLSGDAGAEALLVSVVGRCGAATDAASDELRGALVAALDALARGADDVESRLAAAEAAAAAACRDVGALGSQLERVAGIARRPYVARGAVRREADALRVALRGDAGALAVLASVVGRCDSATDAASDALQGALVAALGALARGAEDVELRLAAAEAAAAAACRDVGALGAQLKRAADIATLPYVAQKAVRRDADALRVALRDDAGALAVLRSVVAQCGTATHAASVALRGPLGAVLGALAGGAENVESRLAAADEACRGALAPVDLLARVASALDRARAASGARTALPAEFSDLRNDLIAASDAASTTVPTHALAALRAIAANDAAVAETELLAAERAVDSKLRAAAAFWTAEAKRRAAAGPEVSALLEPAAFLEQVTREYGGCDIKVCQVVRSAVEGLAQKDAAVVTGRGWVEHLDDAGFRDLPRSVLCVFRELESVCHEKARQWVPALVRKATAALAYLDAREGGADPRAAEAAAQAVAEELPRSNREIARNSRVETPVEENLRLLKRALAEGLRKKEPKADGTAKAQGWGENLSRPERREALRALGKSSPEILKELACLQMCKRAFGTELKPGFGPRLREAAFSVLEELDAAAANALVRPPELIQSESAPAVASKSVRKSKRQRVLRDPNVDAQG